MLHGMDAIRIELPDPLTDFVDRRVSEGGHVDASGYVESLIREDARRQAQAELEALLLDGLEGQATPWTSDDSRRLHRIARNGR